MCWKQGTFLMICFPAVCCLCVMSDNQLGCFLIPPLTSWLPSYKNIQGFFCRQNPNPSFQGLNFMSQPNYKCLLLQSTSSTSLFADLVFPASKTSLSIFPCTLNTNNSAYVGLIGFAFTRKHTQFCINIKS